MKYTVYVKSVNSDSTETQNWKRNRNYLKTRAHSSINKSFRDFQPPGETNRITYIQIINTQSVPRNKHTPSLL